jgi:hypothetical protein
MNLPHCQNVSECAVLLNNDMLIILLILSGYASYLADKHLINELAAYFCNRGFVVSLCYLAYRLMCAHL